MTRKARGSDASQIDKLKAQYSQMLAAVLKMESE
jgi:hypothetical protein